MGHRDEVVLKKVLDEICVAQSMMGECAYPEFAGNEMLKRAVCMTVINIGGLVKNLSENCRKGNPSILWKAVAGFRDIAAHKYQTLKMEDVYETVKSDFPVLCCQIEAVLHRHED